MAKFLLWHCKYILPVHRINVHLKKYLLNKRLFTHLKTAFLLNYFFRWTLLSPRYPSAPSPQAAPPYTYNQYSLKYLFKENPDLAVHALFSCTDTAVTIYFHYDAALSLSLFITASKVIAFPQSISHSPSLISPASHSSSLTGNIPVVTNVP